MFIKEAHYADCHVSSAIFAVVLRFFGLLVNRRKRWHGSIMDDRLKIMDDRLKIMDDRLESPCDAYTKDSDTQ